MKKEMSEMINILFGSKSYDEDDPCYRGEYHYFTLLDDAPCDRETIIARINQKDEGKAAYIIDHIQRNTEKFKTSKDVVSFFNRALAYHYDAERYGTRQRVGVGLRFEILRRDNFRCQICGMGSKDGATLEVDHIIPRSFGGGDDAENLQALCFDCNRGRNNKRLFEK